MLHAENTVRLLECQDEIRTEPYSKRMKSAEGACEKFPDDNNEGTQKKMDIERNSNGCIPVCALDNQGQHEIQKQEDIPSGVLGSLNEILPENNPVLSQPVDLETVQNINPPFASINDSKVEEEKDPFITNNAGEDNIEKSSTSFSVNENESDGDFFTSKDFIGPIYKPAESNKQDKSGGCNECRSTRGDENELCENRCKRKEAKKMQAVSATVPEIEDELDQFYKEIHQLENENLDTNVQEKETEISQEQHPPFNSSQSSQENYQPVLLGSPHPFYESGQCSLGEQSSHKTNNEQQLVVETGGWKTENSFNGQVDAWNCSVPEFRPAWQTRASFKTPQGPFPPRFNHQSHFQIFNPPPQIPNVPLPQNGGLPYESYHHGPLLDQNTNYSGHMDIHSSQVFRNGNNDQNGLQSNGFCETREECWNDSKADRTEGMHSFSSLQLSEERFSCSQKLLLILRGLPGSGKSTLSRVLLGQSCDGIVLSTDDYFRQQYRYTYNAAQLGDAHEWNQKRAKQAMEQGKSPVIIDNTNTQAWEMKPYVEVALEKGYRVEFHEPDTWWKFDPEELEKRNKHGVTREKIAHMLERYEYQISIPIVMNSVVPPHKNSQRPPLQRRHREKILSKNPGYLLTKAKQKKKRKRNKSMKSNHTEITKKMLCGVAHYPIPGDRDGSESEEDDLEEENKKTLCTFSKCPENPVTVSEEQPMSESLKEVPGVSRENFLVTVPEVSVMSNSAWKNELPVESDGLLLRDVKPFCTENLSKNALDDVEAKQRHKDNICSFLTISNDKNSLQETEGISEDYDTSLLSTENKLGTCQITDEPDLEAKLVSLNSEENEISQCYNSNVINNMPDNTEGKCPLNAEETSSSSWAFFSINLSTEKLQMGFNSQVSLSPCSEDKFVSEQRSQNVGKPEEIHMNNSAELNCHQSNEGLLKENNNETETEEVGNLISNGLSASPTGEVHFDSLVEARATFIEGSTEVNVPINDATPITLKRKRYRRIVNLAPKFNLPRQIFGHTEGGKDVLIREDISQNNVLEVRQKHFLSENCGEAHEQDHALQEYSLPTPDADAVLHNISYIHSGQCSPTSKYAFRVCVDSKPKEEQAATLQPQQVVNKKEDEGERVSSEVTNGQPDILSSVKVVSECLEDSNKSASCRENANGADDSDPAKASQFEDYQDADMKRSFLGLPLSLGFAFQLVQLFGSPGLPLEGVSHNLKTGIFQEIKRITRHSETLSTLVNQMSFFSESVTGDILWSLESLLPDDYIVPLDWKVSKMIYLLWKTSVEEKQKTNGLQNGDGLTDDIISLEDLNKNHRENQDSSGTLSDMELCQDVIEENITTCTGCLDAAFHQS